MAKEFKLVERASRGGDERTQVAREILRSTWAVPRDTFITDDMPVLLAKLSRVPAKP